MDVSDSKKRGGMPRLPNNAQYGPFFNELTKENDRSVAIVGVAYLEWLVVTAIRKLIPAWNESAVDYLLGTDSGSGVLRYTNKCDLAHRLGLVGDAGIKDLRTVGTIRNRFAHQLDIRAFADERIVEWCMKLESIKHSPFTATIADREPFAEPRNRFIVTIFQLESVLASTAQRLVHGEQPGQLYSFW